MKKLFMIMMLLGVVAAIGYVLGTESGRARRDELVLRLKGGSDTSSESGATEVDITIDAEAAPSTAQVGI